MDLRSKGRRPENNLPKSESLCSNIGCTNLKRRVATVVAGMWGTMRSTASNVFHFVMIKPSHYDDDGYSIQWIRSAIPSNTLACLNALAEDARRRKILGPDVDIRLHTYDETNRRVRPDRIIRTIRKSGGRAVIGLVGVQSNQFPRAIDLARPFLAAGLPVLAGGFHVSGCIAMLPELPSDLKAAQAMGISFLAGECEDGRLDEVLLDEPGMANSSPSTATWINCRHSPASRRPSFRSSTSSAQQVPSWI